jgi:parallel beta-helix repeat protein
LSFTLFGVTPADAQMQITNCNWVADVPGNYIIANDINCGAGDFGIQVSANNVHIDFNGKTLAGAPIDPDNDVGGFGINTSSTNVFGVDSCSGVTGLHVTGPGTITGWLTGVKLCASSPTEMRARVTGMTLTENRRFGIVLLNSDRNQVKNNILSFNGGLRWGAGVRLSGSNNNRFDTNVVEDNATDVGAAAPKSGGFLLHGILDGRTGSNDNVFKANTINRNGAPDGNQNPPFEFSAGIRLSVSSSGNTVKNNTMIENIQSGIKVFSDDNSIKDNTITDTQQSADTVSNGIHLTPSASNNTIKGNNVSGSNTDLADEPSGVCPTDNTWKNNVFSSSDPVACIQ